MLAERSAESDELVESTLVVGSTIFVDLPEHGVSANFTVAHPFPSFVTTKDTNDTKKAYRFPAA